MVWLAAYCQCEMEEVETLWDGEEKVLHGTTIHFSTCYFFFSTKKLWFSSTKKTIYLYPFTDSTGGQDGVQLRTVLCAVLGLCRHKQLGKTTGNVESNGLVTV